MESFRNAKPKRLQKSSKSGWSQNEFKDHNGLGPQSTIKSDFNNKGQWLESWLFMKNRKREGQIIVKESERKHLSTSDLETSLYQVKSQSHNGNSTNLDWLTKSLNSNMEWFLMHNSTAH